MKSAVQFPKFVEHFGEFAGVLPDGQVLGSRWSDWPEVLQGISRSGWTASWNDDGAMVTLGDLQDPDRRNASFAVRPISSVRVNFFLSDEVLFDIDLREIVDQDALDVICEVVALLGTWLNKTVTLSHEGNFDGVVLRYEPILEEFAMTEPIR